MRNKMKLEFTSNPENESLARSCIAAFAAQMNPTVEQIIELKTAVSEAITNAIVHGYAQQDGTVVLSAYIKDSRIHIQVSDKGCGIEDVEKAKQPFFTTAPEFERSGMGFSVMESFTDEVQVISAPGQGTKVRMKKTIGVGADDRKI